MTVFADSSGFIMDLGMHNGDDTAYYLARGYNVVALEPNSVHANAGRIRFADAIGAGRLKLVEAALWSRRGLLPFHVNEIDDRWSSLDPEHAAHGGAPTHAVEITALTLGDLFDRFGTPLYIKIDVEGAEKTVLDQLSRQLVKPLYTSIAEGPVGFDFITTLAECGYDGFQLVDQSDFSSMDDPDLPYTFPEGSSGPFGDALPGPWLDLAAVEELYSTTVRRRDGERIAPETSTFDIHATKV